MDNINKKINNLSNEIEQKLKSIPTNSKYSNINLNQYADTLSEFLHSICQIEISSNKILPKLKIGFQGVHGAYSEQALYEYFKSDGNIETTSVSQFEDIFKSLNTNKIDYGILPIENSSTGAVTDVYDLLNKYNFHITGEVCIKINNYLLATKGTNIDDIKEVYSHYQALEQCKEFLKAHPNWKVIPYSNTAKSAELVAQKNCKYAAAIASIKAAKLYNLEILKENINTNKSNYTRFVVISKNLNIDDECNKVSVVFSLPHKAGSLYSALQYFSDNKINMMKIESRPIKNIPWEYFFYIDFEGNLNDETVKRAIEKIKNSSYYFKLLGNYKKYDFENI